MIQEVRILHELSDAEEGFWPLSEDSLSTFLKEMLPRHNPMIFSTSWDSGLVIVGSQNRINSELDELIGPGMQPSELGAMREVVRPFDPHRPVGWGSLLMSAHADKPVWANWHSTPGVAILDGSYAVGRWLEECQAPLVIAILDRAEPGLDSAVSVLRQRRAYADPLDSNALSWEQPPGCELFAFRSAV